MRTACWIALLTLVVRAGEPPPRIASFSPAATRILVDLGATPQIAAATRWCELPAEHPAPRTCDAFEPDPEALRRSGATVAILPRLANPMLEARVRSLGIRSVVLAAEAEDSPATDIATLGRLTGQAERAAQLLEARRRCQQAATDKRVLILWDDVCAGPSSYLAWVIHAAGAQPAPPAGAWPPWDIERTAASRPDLVLILKKEAPQTPELDPQALQQWRETPGLRLTHAARAGCIYHVKLSSDWLPASGLPEAAKTLSKLLEK